MSARSSDWRGRLEGRAVAGDGLGPAEDGALGPGGVAVPPSVAGVDQGDEAARRRPPGRCATSSPSATTAVAPEWASTWPTSAGARRGFMGTATPPARWAAE